MQILQGIVHAILATLTLSSFSYVLGTAVGHQYFSSLVGFPGTNSPEERAFRSVLRRWYVLGGGFGILVLMGRVWLLSSPLGTESLDKLMMPGLVLVPWLGSTIEGWFLLRKRIVERDVVPEYLMLGVALGLFSGISGTLATVEILKHFQ